MPYGAPTQMSDAYQAFIESAARDIAQRVSDELIARLEKRCRPSAADPLLTVKQAAAVLAVSPSTTRQLVAAGELMRAPGMTEIRIRSSVVASYATKK